MNLNEYQEKASSTAQYPISTFKLDTSHEGLIYQTMWMAGFVGNICNQVKKLIRDDNGVLTSDRKEKLDTLVDEAIQALNWIGQSLNNESNLSERLDMSECIGICYTTLGLMGESGELCDDAKDLIETKDEEEIQTIRSNLRDELGDVAWYVATTAKELDRKLDSICEANLAKLKSRRERDMISGDGDHR